MRIRVSCLSRLVLQERLRLGFQIFNESLNLLLLFIGQLTFFYFVEPVFCKDIEYQQLTECLG